MTRRIAWLTAEALWTSARVRFALAFLPFRRVRRWLGAPQDPETPVPRAWDDAGLVRDVRRAARICERHAPWASCYALALTGKIMLERRNVPATLFIGLKRDNQRHLAGHAWLMSGGIVVAGDGDIGAYAIHGCYR